MKIKLRYFEITYESAFAGKRAASFPTEAERDAFYERVIKPEAWGNDPLVFNVEFSQRSFYVDDDEADLWIREGYSRSY